MWKTKKTYAKYIQKFYTFCLVKDIFYIKKNIDLSDLEYVITKINVYFSFVGD